ncbi:MAG: GtrA family protein [Deferrisomatales bacterium]|nr:GtrA family protein [Deferrisomatales bacterium]
MRPIFAQFLVFSAVGTVGTAVHFAVLVGLVQAARTNPVPASVAGFVVGALVNYLLNYHVTFRSRKRHGGALVRFFTVALAGLGWNTVIMFVATRWAHYLLSQMLATAAVLVWNFLCNRFWTFKEVAVARR